MNRALINGVELEYEVTGSGEALLLISPVIADAYLPFMSYPALAEHHQLIRYHRRGWSGSTHTPAPVSIADHAADAAALLDHLGVSRAHVAGHSSGGPIALQLAFDRADLVASLALLEPSLLWVASAQALFERAATALQAFGAGDHAAAVVGFLTVVSGLEQETCRATIDANIPGAIAQATSDAGTFFGIELPSVMEWTMDAEQAGAVTAPVLSVLGTRTDPVWVEADQLLQSWFPQLERQSIDGIGHLLELQAPEPVARCIAEFVARHPIRGSVPPSRRDKHPTTIHA